MIYIFVNPFNEASFCLETKSEQTVTQLKSMISLRCKWNSQNVILRSGDDLKPMEDDTNIDSDKHFCEKYTSTVKITEITLTEDLSNENGMTVDKIQKMCKTKEMKMLKESDKTVIKSNDKQKWNIETVKCNLFFENYHSKESPDNRLRITHGKYIESVEGRNIESVKSDIQNACKCKSVEIFFPPECKNNEDITLFLVVKAYVTPRLQNNYETNLHGINLRLFTFFYENEYKSIKDRLVIDVLEDANSILSLGNAFSEAKYDPNFLQVFDDPEMIDLFDFAFPRMEFKRNVNLGSSMSALIKTLFGVCAFMFNNPAMLRTQGLNLDFARNDPNSWYTLKHLQSNMERCLENRSPNTFSNLLKLNIFKTFVLPYCQAIGCQEIANLLQGSQEKNFSEKKSFLVCLSRRSLMDIAKYRTNFLEDIDFWSISEKLQFLSLKKALFNRNKSKNCEIIFSQLFKKCDDNDLKLLFQECSEIKEAFDAKASKLNMEKLSLPPWPKTKTSNTLIHREKLEETITKALVEHSDPHTVLLHGSSASGKTTLCWQILEEKKIQNHFPGGVLFLHGENIQSDKSVLNKIKEYILTLKSFDPEKLESVNIKKQHIHFASVEEEIMEILNNNYLPRFLIVLDNLREKKYAEKLMKLPFHYLITSHLHFLYELDDTQLIKIEVPSELTVEENNELWSIHLSMVANVSITETNLLKAKSFGRKSAFLINLLAPLVSLVSQSSFQSLLENDNFSLFTTESIEEISSYLIGRSLLIGMGADREEKYKMMKFFDSENPISSFLMKVLWNCEEEEEAVIILDEFYKRSLLKRSGHLGNNHSDIQTKATYCLHSLHKFSLEGMKDHKSNEQYFQEIFDRLRLTCVGEWHKLPAHDSTLWSLIIKVMIGLNRLEDFYEIFLCDLRVVNTMILSFGVFETIIQIKSFISKNVQNVDHQFLEELIACLRRCGSFLTSKKYSEKDKNRFNLLKMALFENQESKIHAIAIRCVQERDLKWSYAFDWCPIINGNVNLTISLDAEIKGVHVPVIEHTNILFIATKNNKIHRLFENELKSFQLPLKNTENIVSIEQEPDFVIVSKVDEGILNKRKCLHFYHPNMFMNDDNPSLTPLSELSLACVKVHSITCIKRTGNNQKCYYFAVTDNMKHNCIYKLNSGNEGFCGQPTNVFRLPYPEPNKVQVNIKFLASINKRFIYSDWTYQGENEEQNNFLLVIDTITDEYAIKLTTTWSQNSLKRNIHIDVKDKSEMKVFKDKNLTIFDENMTIIFPKDNKHEKNDLIKMFDHIEKETWKGPHMINNENGNEFYIDELNSYKYSITYKFDKVCLTSSSLSKLDSLNKILFWKQIVLENVDYKLFQLIAIDNKCHLKISKIKVFCELGIKKMEFDNKINSQFTSENYFCHLFWLEMNSVFIIVKDKQMGYKKKILHITIDENVQKEALVNELEIPSSVSSDDSNETIEEQYLFITFLKNENRVILGISQGSSGIKIIQYHNRIYEKDYVLHFMESYEPNKMRNNFLSEINASIQVTYPVVVRNLTHINDGNYSYFIERYILCWDEHLDHLTLINGKSESEELNFHGDINLQMCNCGKIFSLYRSIGVQIFKQPSLVLLKSFDPEPFYVNPVAILPHNGSDSSCRFAILFFNGSLKIYKVDHEMETENVIEIFYYPFTFQPELSPKIMWSSSGNKLHIFNKYNTVWTFQKSDKETTPYELIDETSLNDFPQSRLFLSIEDDLVIAGE